MSRTITAWINAKKYYVVPIAIYFDGYFEPSKIDFINEERQLESAIKGEFILEQSTGLEDKNGKEIFEGSIVTTPYGISKIEFYNDVACFGYSVKSEFGKLLRYAIKGEELEVIGNIHDSKDLLE